MSRQLVLIGFVGKVFLNCANIIVTEILVKFERNGLVVRGGNIVQLVLRF